MTVGAGGSRHLSPLRLLEHWNSNVPVAIPLAGDPAGELLIDRPRRRLTLRLPAPTIELLPANPLAHVDVQLTYLDNTRTLEISVTDEELLIDGHAMLSAIVDRVQLEEVDPASALTDTLARWRSVLALRARMSLTQEVGLFGELLVVERLLAEGLDPGLRSWRGSLSEEHDFGFAKLDVEVKTTVGERRQHWVHGLNQLMPTGQRPLVVLSVQLTRAGVGDGRALPQLVEDLLEKATNQAHERLRAGIEGAGFRENEADLFTDRWRVRSRPLSALVDERFPRLTPSLLNAADVQSERIRDVRYEIDLTDMPEPAPLPEPLSSLMGLFSEYDD